MINKLNCGTLIFCCASLCVSLENVSANSVAIVSVDHSEDFRIINRTDGNECGRFSVRVVSEPKKCADGSLEFKLRIDLRNFDGIIRYENKEIQNSEHGKVFDVEIPKYQLENRIFYKKIRIEPDDTNFKFEKIKLKIEPAVEISADQRQVDFGKIFSSNGRLLSSNSPTVCIRYSVLKDAVCLVTSKNNFQLRCGNNYIPYSMNHIYENSTIELPSERDSYCAEFRISPNGKTPAAGKYSDKITFSIQANG